MRYIAFSLGIIVMYATTIYSAKASQTATLVVGGISFLIVGIAVALFLHKNRKLIEKIAYAPSAKLFIQLLIGKPASKKGENTDK